MSTTPEIGSGSGSDAPAERAPSERCGPFGTTPEQMRQRAHLLSHAGERREAADLLRLAVHAAEEQGAGAPRLIPLVESLAEVLWQLNEKREARLHANRALGLYFSGRS
ncbi:MAG: hypothetical protein R3244_02270 [Thermoanaerobaculia bacterium]|nr:hypothetical protein [Thermoanaerobaculia bacterium]